MRKPLLALICALAVAAVASPAPASAAPVRWWNETTADLSVGGTYVPLVGNFAGEAQDDIVWHAAGAATDHLWQSDGDASFTKTPMSAQVPDTVFALVGDFAGDGHDDVLFYGPGSVADVLWTATSGGFRPSSKSIGGTYQPTVIDDGVGKDDILWYATPSTSSIWSFQATAGLHRSQGITVPSGAEVVTGRFDTDACADLFFYRPGDPTDAYLTLDCDGRTLRNVSLQIRGSYQPIVGRFTPNDAQEDILWRGATSSLWSNEVAGRFAQLPVHVPVEGMAIVGNLHWGQVHIWNETTGTHKVWFLRPATTGSAVTEVNQSVSNTAIDSRYRPIVGSFVDTGEDILWYAPGSAPERMFWNIESV